MLALPPPPTPARTHARPKTRTVVHTAPRSEHAKESADKQKKPTGMEWRGVRVWCVFIERNQI